MLVGVVQIVEEPEQRIRFDLVKLGVPPSYSLFAYLLARLSESFLDTVKRRKQAKK